MHTVNLGTDYSAHHVSVEHQGTRLYWYVLVSVLQCMDRTALRLNLDGDQIATQLLMSSAWNEAAVNVIQNEWKQQVSHLPAGRHNCSFTFRFGG